MSGTDVDQARLVETALRSESYVQVRRRVFRQLVESLLYEGAVTTRGTDDNTGITVDGVDADGRPVAYLITVGAAGAFGRVRVTGPVLRTQDGATAEAESLSDFLAEVRGALGADPGRLAGFVRELEETLLKDAVAQHVRARRGDVLAGAGFDELESTVMDGHRYHPVYKSRIGFDTADNLAYGPEFGRPVRPVWLAAHRRAATVTTARGLDATDFLHSELGGTADRFRQLLAGQGRDPDDHVLLPVHPWQWREVVASAYRSRLCDGDLVVLGEDPADHTAQQSIRTLSCRDDPARANLKLSLSMLNTSTSRVLAPHTVANAPLITDWLRHLVDGDPYLRDELRPVVLGEVMGVSVEAGGPDLSRSAGYGALGCIWRESLPSRLEPSEGAVPFTALTARELDGTPFLDGWIRGHGLGEWLRTLVRVAVPPLLHLLQAHGVALEAHAQNMALIHSGGLPTRVALRDFHDGVRFSRRHLAEPERCPPLVPPPAYHVNRNSFLEADEPDQVTDFLLDAFCFVNLGELGRFLDEAYNLPEAEFWTAVRQEVDAYHQRFPELAPRFSLFDVGRPSVEVEKLTTRRLLPDTELRLHAVPNPLARR